MTHTGAVLFARYAYPPNQLGYCGPGDASVLLNSATAEAEQRIAEHARRFEGAWAYLEIIAAAAGIGDPLDARVVEAYWLGNELLDAVDPARLVTELQDRFPGQAGANWVPGRPHHGFHVFAVYPWVGLLHRGRASDVALSVLQQCRIRWGVVTAVGAERASVRTRPLVLRDGMLELGSAREESPVWSAEGRSLVSDVPGERALAVGDQVAMHFDWVCDVLRSDQVSELEKRSDDQLARTNKAFRTAAA